MPVYQGFTTVEYETTKVLGLSDLDIVKRDLLNHIFTRVGERVKMPNFGTRIPDLLFDPLDEILLDVIEEDLTTVGNYDPRVVLNEVIIVPFYDQNTVVAGMDLTYIELDLRDTFAIQIDFENNNIEVIDNPRFVNN